jgi:hypothetical protein
MWLFCTPFTSETLLIEHMHIFEIVTISEMLTPRNPRFNEWVFERCMLIFERLAAVNVLQSDQKHQSCIPCENMGNQQYLGNGGAKLFDIMFKSHSPATSASQL